MVLPAALKSHETNADSSARRHKLCPVPAVSQLIATEVPSAQITRGSSSTCSAWLLEVPCGPRGGKGRGARGKERSTGGGGGAGDRAAASGAQSLYRGPVARGDRVAPVHSRPGHRAVPALRRRVGGGTSRSPVRRGRRYDVRARMRAGRTRGGSRALAPRPPLADTVNRGRRGRRGRRRRGRGRGRRGRRRGLLAARHTAPSASAGHEEVPLSRHRTAVAAGDAWLSCRDGREENEADEETHLDGWRCWLARLGSSQWCMCLNSVCTSPCWKRRRVYQVRWY